MCTGGKVKRKEDRSGASLRSAASERKPLKINSEKGKRNEGRREVPRRTENRTFWTWKEPWAGWGWEPERPGVPTPT